MYVITNDDIFGSNVLYLRTNRGISQECLAKTLGITSYQLQLIEQGYLRDIDAELLEKICTFFSVSHQSILRYDLTQNK